MTRTNPSTDQGASSSQARAVGGRAPRIVLAGGGSAGHTSPLVATAQQLQLLAPDAELVCIGTARGLETRVIPEAGLPLELIDPVPMPRRPSIDLVKVPTRLARAVAQAGRVLDGTTGPLTGRADVLVGFGGYVSMPAYLAARRRGIPVVVHEQNTVPGLANKVAARFAALVATAFPNSGLRNEQFVGMPVRTAIATARARRDQQGAVRKELGLAPELPTLLVSGGSQGARSINTATWQAREALLAAGINVLHIWGRRNFDDQQRQVDPSGAVYQPVAYVDAMDQAYVAADMMLGRSGAGTVVETAIAGVVGLFVPLPHGNGEQRRNATSLEQARAAILVDDADLDAELVERTVLEVITDPVRLEQMRDAAGAIFSNDAAEVLAAMVLAVAEGQRPQVEAVRAELAHGAAGIATGATAAPDTAGASNHSENGEPHAS